MTSRSRHMPAFVLALALVCVAAAGYRFLSPQPPEEPNRRMFVGKAGNVLFDHTTHVNDYGLDCIRCHHNLEDEDEIYSCAECHAVLAEDLDDEDMLTKTDALHDQCISCHREEAGPVECARCHAR